jgi:broad specificity phosphatase PhoE
LKKTVWIIRHGETELNALNIVQGQGINAPLNNTGHDQALQFWQYYHEIPFDLVLYSNLLRSQQTVNSFLTKGVQAAQLDDLKEINWGVNEGQASSPIVMQRFQDVQNAWQNGDFDARIEGGESANEMALRARNCINYLKEIKRNQILVCSHGRTIRALVCLMHYESLEKMEEYHHANLGLYKFELEHNKWNCILKNDTKHLMKSLQMN